MNANLGSLCFFWFFFFGFNLLDFAYRVNSNYKSEKKYKLNEKQSQMRTLTTIKAEAHFKFADQKLSHHFPQTDFISPFPFYFAIKALNNR